MLLIKKDTSVLIKIKKKTRKTDISMDATFLEKQPFFQKISLSGENIGEEGKFLDVILNPLPKTIDCITNPIPQN